ncbi:hypothetical protein LJR164_001643 [Phenylobacterium sp. LjRoot164]|uniref:hypothetical protein n=1 Tax=unclassified Phenylobacterium TaxID=2640670 RepID=UPI003ED13EFD
MATALASIGATAGTNAQIGNDARVLTLDAGAAVGDVVAGFVYASSSVLLSSITDPKGNTWTIRTAYNSAGTERWYFVDAVITNALAAADTLTFNFSGTAGRRAIVLGKMTEMNTSDLFDKQGAGTAGATTTTPTLSVDAASQANSVILCGMYFSSIAGNITEDADYTDLGSVSFDNRKVHLAGRVVTSAAADTYNPTNSASNSYNGNWAIYKVAGAPPPATVTSNLALLGVG